MSVQRCEKFSAYTDNNNTMEKQGCVNTTYTDNDCNNARKDGRWWAVCCRLKKGGLVALKKADLAAWNEEQSYDSNRRVTIGSGSNSQWHGSADPNSYQKCHGSATLESGLATLTQIPFLFTVYEKDYG